MLSRAREGLGMESVIIDVTGGAGLLPRHGPGCVCARALTIIGTESAARRPAAAPPGCGGGRGRAGHSYRGGEAAPGGA